MRSPFSLPQVAGLLFSFGAAACGGIVVFDDAGTGGGGEGGNGGFGAGPQSVGSNSTTASGSSSTGIAPVGGGGPNLFQVDVTPNAGDIQYESTSKTLGITAVAQTATKFADVAIDRQTAPGGSVVFDGILPGNGATWEWFETVSMAAPQISHPSSFPLAPGIWTFHVNSPSPTLTTSFWVRETTDGAFHGGVMDVNFFVPVESVDEAYLADIAAQAYEDFGGIGLGDVRIFPIGEQYLSIDENNLFDALDETKIAPTRPAMNVIVTSEITGQFEGAAGFATGVPGSPMNPGSAQGALVWWAFQDGFFDRIILRHETGHMSGLFHTNEFEPGLTDPLDDTPFCPDVNQGGCDDEPYIMHPAGGDGTGIISAQQARVIQGGASYRGSYASGEPPMTPYGPDIVSNFGRRVSADRLARAREKARTTVLTRGNTAWRSQTSEDIARALEGIGCANAATESVADRVVALGPTADELLLIANDATAPLIARRRAVVALGRLSPSALEGVIRSDAMPPAVRSGALRTLAKIDTVLAKRIASELSPNAPALLSRVAKALR